MHVAPLSTDKSLIINLVFLSDPELQLEDRVIETKDHQK